MPEDSSSGYMICTVREFYRSGEGVQYGKWKVLWQMLRMYDFRGKLLNGIMGMYADISACVRAKGG